MPDKIDLIGGRYVLHEPLGGGGSGIVYRAIDRLTGQTVALKRLPGLTEPQSPDLPVLTSAADQQRLALTNEFQTLASLRHPNIIGVLDYGFDDQGQPYFSMEYLAEAQTLVQAGRGQPLESRLGLLFQLLQALTYLHRRGILHRDLKPGNVLVAGEEVKVLDFGLSVASDRASGTVGSFSYMAPEVVVGRLANEASDLYAVGVMAYELFAGRHPFDLADIGRLIHGILNTPPDLAAFEGDGRLAAVVGRLLDKEPAARYPTAQACITAFSQAVGLPPPRETVAIRESFLQAARFVGRQAELGQLTNALQAARGSQGSIWLVGGESGVGKTRLLDELRARALVAGVLVLRGQAMARGGVAYQSWREPLRRLVLTTSLSDLEAGTLKQLVPDLGTLLRRTVPDVPDLGGQAGQRRLLDTVIAIFRRQESPALLILEDMQWAGESLDILQYLSRVIHELPLLVVGSYRDDERPDLPADLPGAQVMTLNRLTGAEIADLSASMLGAAGRQPDVLALLQRETEGNAFFLVEVARALAQEAGRLDEIVRMRLPAQVFPKGIQTIIRRRLARVPDDAQALLRLTAVAGRQVDLAVLAHLAEGISQEDWLTACANAAVLELRDGRWRFVHDKLREGLLDSLEPGERVALHLQAAQAIEAAHPDNPEVAADLVHHWQVAGNREKECHYARLAGEHAASQFVNDQALFHLGRALQLTAERDTGRRYALLRTRERVYDLLAEREAQRRDLLTLATLVNDLDDGGPQATRRRAELAWRWAAYNLFTTDFPVCIEAAQEAIHLAQAAGDMGIEAAGHLVWAQALWRNADFVACRTQLERAMVLARLAGTRQWEADSLRILGNVDYYLGDYANATAYWELALPISREIGDRVGEASALSNLGEGARSQGAYARAREYYEQRLRICREIGERYGEGIALLNLSLVSHNLGENEAAREYALQVLRIGQETGNRSQLAYAQTNLGYALAGLGHLDEAAGAYQQGLALRRESGENHLAMELLAGLARARLRQGDLAQAQAITDEILSFLQTNTLDGTEEPFRVHLTCYRVLQAIQDPRAQEVLATAHALLQERAARIPDDALRRSFLENVPYHREIVQEWEMIR